MHKNNREIIRENAFEQKKKKPGLALLGLRTTGPWGLDGIRPWTVKFPMRSRVQKRHARSYLRISFRQSALNTQTHDRTHTRYMSQSSKENMG